MPFFDAVEQHPSFASKLAHQYLYDGLTRIALFHHVDPQHHLCASQGACKRWLRIRVVPLHDSRDVPVGEFHFHPRLQANHTLTCFQLEVKQVEVLGNINSGGTQLLGPITAGQLASEPGFELQFNGSAKYAGDYLTQDPTDGIARPACVGAVYPDDGDTPFLFRISGVDHASAKAVEIFTSGQNLNLSIPYGYSYSGLSLQIVIARVLADSKSQCGRPLSMAGLQSTLSFRTACSWPPRLLLPVTSRDTSSLV